jgi:hypothetical protein
MKHLSYFLICLVIIAGCKKNGTGGKASVAVFPSHHGSPIEGCTVYVKFAAKELPSGPTMNYDLKAEGVAGASRIDIKGLRAGNYFFYATGFDSSHMEAVNGGIPVEISWKDRKNEMSVTLPMRD